jgi:glutamyl-tRNA synthetase
MAESTTVRVRFAPSPTGFLHVGGLRTALYNFLFARKNGGVFILRIEDTDRTRFVEGALKNLVEIFRWVGLEYDEGPVKEGPYAPYIQSERLRVYEEHVKSLLDAGKAYRCFCMPERLQAMRKEQEKRRLSLKYDRTCLRLSSAQVEDNLKRGTPFVIRMMIPDARTVRFNDIIRGEVEIHSDQLDDQVLLKSDGFPTYHLANVVDDHLMGITHVIRGEEWLSSTPKHVLLYEYFGWEMPKFAHLPLLLNPDKSKLSKRQGDVAVEDYRAKGYLKEALINFVALLGWNPGTKQEIFSMDELIDQFSLERVNKAGAVFSLEKLNWLNFEHLRKKSDADVLEMLREYLRQSEFANKHFDDQYLMKIIRAMRERVAFVKDFVQNSPYFFEAPASYDPNVVKKRWKPETPRQLKNLIEEFSKLQNPGKDDYEASLHRSTEALHIDHSSLIHAVRLAVSGVGAGPGLYDILWILGKNETIRRINSAIERLGA